MGTMETSSQYILASIWNRPERKKKAALLHFGGLDLQEIFYNLPGADVEPSEGTDVFKIAISKLDAYFAPKQCTLYERHVFRLIQQEPTEKFEKFVLRLRQQADKCEFKNKEEHIVDQVIEKCFSNELRRKILKIGDEMTLDRAINEANALETVNKQMEEFEKGKTPEQTINKVDTKEKPWKNYRGSRCGRCGNYRHPSNSDKCPARDKDCLKCGLRGHFRQWCKTKSNLKRNNTENTSNKPNPKKPRLQTKSNTEVNQIEDDSNDDQNGYNYVFHIDEDLQIDCVIGGIKTKMIIDSGCKHNLITGETWEVMKRRKVAVSNQIAKPDIRFVAYGSNKPLEVKGCFNATLQVEDKQENATFFVIANGTRNLLGKQTAMSLGILKIGLNLGVNQVNEEERTTFPKFKDVLVSVHIDDSVPAVSQPYRRIPIPLEAKVETKLQELIDKDIIEEVPGSSKWVSPIVPILKDNGDIRLCVDMRRANTAILRENHPLPTMDQLLPKMRDAKYFTKLDIKDAFHQVELHPDSRHITTFITSKGLFRYKRLMFGISCAPEIFQKVLERMLLGCDGVFNFIDDILIFGRDLEEHDKRLKKVMEVLKENNVVLKKEKCLHRVKKVSFLGHELSDAGVRPLQKYVTTVQEFRPPVNVSELQSFLGLINYVGKWIPNLATVTEPFKVLLRNKNAKTSDIQKDWGSKQEEAFEYLKSTLSNIPNLGYYNVNDKTIVIADASPVGLGAVLIQVNDRGPRIIAYGHKTLTDCERRYCQTEKEALALVWAVEHFHIFLYGKDFELITDHKPLEVIFGPKSKPCARIERWILRLQSYRYKVVYKPGKTNIADPLSRLLKLPTILPTTKEDHIHQIVEYTRPVAVSMRELLHYSREDNEIKSVKEAIYNNKWGDEAKSFKVFQSELCFYEGLLLRGTRIVIPKELRERVLNAAHEGHPGIVAMKARMRTKVWWPACDKDAENFVKACRGCTLVSAPNPPNPMKRREIPEDAWMDVAIDLMGPLPSGDYLLVVVDYFSRYKEIKICRKITSTEIIGILKEIFSRLGNPLTITADNGRQFCSEEFKSFCKEQNITLFNTIPYWPQQNGEVERQNRDILKRLKISQAEKTNWRESLYDYLVMYNSTPHSVTGKTPSELFFKRKFRDKIPMAGDMGLEPYETESEMKDRDKIMKEKGKEYGDRKRKATECDLEPGDKVYIKNMIKDNKLSLNFDTTSHTVEKAVGGDIQVRNDKTGQSYRRNVVHLKKIQGQWKVIDSDKGEDNSRDSGEGNDSIDATE
ncbi:uncharacterized protein K02A2.6-like [Plodia interpunctella]|uniref:uncharacterized protein K02A2.6-like n=2 Tax=Plodia interpunctella TaxID=58824 RepID=UPI0023685A2C|nr:uncharacterized protein K02A2.6-like [Plodia interpunctella]XP_053623643.1 uncharacterized protein K02A2.6-like [Plodia interpunctella]